MKLKYKLGGGINVGRPGVSIVIPCYNESKRIKKTIAALNEHLHYNAQDEVIFVDDGCNDKTVWNIFDKRQFEDDKMRVVSYAQNRGKWYAIRTGYFNAKKEFVLFLDADLSVGLDVLEDLQEMNMFRGKLIVGNRYVNEATYVPFGRLIASRVFNKLAKKINKIDVSDSQCPMKLLPKTQKMNDIMWSMKEEGFCGDVELLVRAKKAKVKIAELSVIYEFENGSSINVRKHAPEMFRALLRIRRYV